MIAAFFILFASLTANAAEFDTVTVDTSLNLPFLSTSTVPYVDSSGNMQSSSVSPTQLGYVDFTSSGQTQLNSKAPLASPALTGSPTAPTQTQGDNSTKISTTAYVDTAVSNATIPDATTLVKGKVKLAGDLGGTADLPTVPGLSGKEPSISSGTTSQYWRGDKSFHTLDTSVVPENGNLYFTNGRVDTEFDTRLATKSTSNLLEGSNLYFTNARVDTEFDTRLATKSTSNLSEGSNLYYTDARVQTLAKNNISAQVLYVSQDVGNDSTGNGSRLKPYQTISAAVTAANGIASFYKQVVIHIEPSNTSNGYNENVTLSQQGVNLVCESTIPNARVCIVNGSLTVNLTGTANTGYTAASNEVYVSGMEFSANNATALIFSGSVYQKLFIYNSYFSSGTAIAATVTNSGSSAGTLSGIRVWDTNFEDNSSTNEVITLSAGTLYFYGTSSFVQNDNASGPSVNQTGSSILIASLVQFTGQYKLDNTSIAYFNLSSIASGANSCILTGASANTGYADITYFGCNSSATNSITGSGVVVNGPGNNRFGSSGDIISTVTQVNLGPGLPQGEIMLGAGATTGTHVNLSSKDGHTKMAQTTAPTTTLSGNAGTGGSPACTVAHTTDNAGVLTLKTGTSAWSSGTQCTLNYNLSWGVAPVCVWSPANSSAASKAVTQQINFPATATGSATVNFGAADTAQTTYIWQFMCMETQ